MNVIRTDNHGPLVRSSTYWGGEEERAGYYYLTPNAGTFRLLVPASRSSDIPEIRTAKEVIITFGPHRQHDGREMSEILFDDRTDSPFALYLSVPDQWERLPAAEDFTLFYEFTAWENRRGTPHKIISRPCYLRKAELPCRKPWPKA